ncbi:MAG: type VI secretion system protein TssA [Planctomycetes bacterium]|nr:type VI secretion system protein TssA [Planctomycetota bacterium]
MSLIDIEKLLKDVSTDAPCGEDLSYDPAYTEMERILTQGVSEGMVDGAAAAEEVGPDWRDFRNRCVELLGRTKDLRVAVDLTLALLMEDGIQGLRDGLVLLDGLIERFWDHVHPQLDPQDDNDPIERMNIIGSLSPAQATYMDPMMFCKRVREAPLCKSARLGKFSLRDIESAGVVAAEGKSEGEAGPNAALITAAFEDTATEDLLGIFTAVEDAVKSLRAIEDKLNERVGAGRVPDLSKLRDETLGKVRTTLQGYMSRRGLGVAGASSAEGADRGDVADAEHGEGGGGAGSGEVRSPQDVLAVLEKVCRYYERREPSSPVPLLIKRAQRLVSKNFMEIVRDLTPESMGQIEKLSGIDSSASKV